jgi:phospholipid/cholesterol/gamma-HCH transport system ATP-binding protein
MLKLESVGLELGGREIFSGINLELGRDEAIALIGPSGAGKTLLLKVACGLIPASRGKIFLFGQNLAEAGFRERQALFQKIGFSFQQSALFDFLELESNLAFPLKEGQELKDREIRPRVLSLAHELGLLDAISKMPAELSGGMKKRVSLGRALIHRPQLLFCDDPTAGLDPITASAISDLILKLKGDLKFSLLLVSNESSVLKKLADRVYLLYRGRLQEAGSGKEIEFRAGREWGKMVGEYR